VGHQTLEFLEAQALLETWLLSVAVGEAVQHNLSQLRLEAGALGVGVAQQEVVLLATAGVQCLLLKEMLEAGALGVALAGAGEQAQLAARVEQQMVALAATVLQTQSQVHLSLMQVGAAVRVQLAARVELAAAARVELAVQATELLEQQTLAAGAGVPTRVLAAMAAQVMS
jgi:hypothetical protein